MMKLSHLKRSSALAALMAILLAQGALASTRDASQAQGEETKRGRRVLENQAIGRAVDKKPIGIAAIRRWNDKRQGKSGDASGAKSSSAGLGR
ncbi:hypothetical protein [Chromobacterium sp. IIBBL 290-4]|uniref:hypothetical protein n=1 Tax=Chromobacterium sp. IIBBL 290-4 TaxID=2953890 RepID=UPI0020B76EEA|nr:hypothetical protein [Chromobacterium sp. IIBBL 290-4]UTH76653.1 hypothetical protein NKT35_11350 [Chromobacterium sp. IIBBL 290-4]